MVLLPLYHSLLWLLLIFPRFSLCLLSPKAFHLPNNSNLLTHRQAQPSNNNNGNGEQRTALDDASLLGRSSLTVSQTKTTTTTLSKVEVLKKQAEELRLEALSLRKSLNETKIEKAKREIEQIDAWMNDLLVNVSVDENTQILNTVEQVTETLQEKRYSPEQINKIFKRLVDTSPTSSITNDPIKSSPMLSLLIEASGKIDMIDREENPNKRWRGMRVEMKLRRKLFHMQYGTMINDDEDYE